MRRLLLAALIIGGMFYLGWLSFSNDSSNSALQLDKTEVKADAEQAVEKVKEFIHEGTDAAKSAVDSPSGEAR